MCLLRPKIVHRSGCVVILSPNDREKQARYELFVNFKFLQELETCELDFISSSDLIFFCSVLMTNSPKSSTFYFSFFKCEIRFSRLLTREEEQQCYSRVAKWMTLAILGLGRRNRWNKLMKHRVSSGRTCSVSHVDPADDCQLIQHTSIMFSDSNEATICSSCQLLTHPRTSHQFT